MSGILPILIHGWRAAHRVATRLWHDGPVALLMVGYLGLTVTAEVINGLPLTASAYLPTVIFAFFCWLVWRRGRISRGMLIWFSAGGLLKAADLEQWWHVQSLAVFALSLLALALLLSPAVYVRTHPGSFASSSGIRLRPRSWMILAAPLAGAAAAGLALAMPRRWGLPTSGCMDAVQNLPQRCVGAGRGFPVPVEATVHGYHAVSQAALFQDWAQWTWFIFTVSYLIWLAVHRRGREPGVRSVAQRA